MLEFVFSETLIRSPFEFSMGWSYSEEWRRKHMRDARELMEGPLTILPTLCSTGAMDHVPPAP